MLPGAGQHLVRRQNVKKAAALVVGDFNELPEGDLFQSLGAAGFELDRADPLLGTPPNAVILARSTRPGHDVDYWFGQVSIDKPLVDWSGNCGNLSTAVGPYAIANGLIDPVRVPRDGTCVVRIWQQGDRVTMAPTDCADKCTRGAFDYAWPIEFKTTGGCA